MAWTIEIEQKVQKSIKRLEPKTAERIYRFLYDRVRPLENPRSIGQAMVGPAYGDYWKYRVGDYRLIARIEDERVLIVIIKIGDRKDVYR